MSFNLIDDLFVCTFCLIWYKSWICKQLLIIRNLVKRKTSFFLEHFSVARRAIDGCFTHHIIFQVKTRTVSERHRIFFFFYSIITVFFTLIYSSFFRGKCRSARMTCPALFTDKIFECNSLKRKVGINIT